MDRIKAELSEGPVAPALACNRALSGQDAKSGRFAYYLCQSIMRRDKDACDTPRLRSLANLARIGRQADKDPRKAHEKHTTPSNEGGNQAK